MKGLRTEGRIDARGAEVDAVIERAAPLAIYADGGDSVEITPPAGGYQLDAVANDGSITHSAGDSSRSQPTVRSSARPGPSMAADRRSRCATHMEASRCDPDNADCGWRLRSC